MPPVPRLQIVTSRTLAQAARRRRRRLQVRLAGLLVLVAGVALVVVDTAGGQAHGAATRTTSAAVTMTHATTTPSATPAAARTATTPSATPPAAVRPALRRRQIVTAVDPLTTPAMRKLLAGRDGKVTAAVQDLRTGREWVLDPTARDQTASIVKADILETLLDQAQTRGTPLADVETSTATGMIEASDNDDATDLFDEVGGASGLAAYNSRAGLDQTTPSDAWGETLTSASDQIRLLRQLALPHGVLSAAAVNYELDLMRDIDPGENWGVTGGVPASAKVKVALKNGWVPLSSGTDWEVNSIGWIDGENHDYLIAVLTAHDPSEAYGISTISAMSKLIYDTLGPAPAAGTRTITADTAEGPET